MGDIDNPREYVFIIDYGVVKYGQWCDTCLTPGIFETSLHHISEGGVSVIGNIVRCTTCNPYEDSDD